MVTPKTYIKNIHYTLLFSTLFYLFSVNCRYRLERVSDAQETPETLLLKDYKPKSIYKIPATEIKKAKYPVIDMHAHAYVRTPEELDNWMKVMRETGVEKVIILSNAHGAEFDSVMTLYSRYPEHFEVWCGFDYTGYEQPSFGPAAVQELERCYQKGARGVGEIGDKGRGLFYCDPKAWGMHLDDARMDPLLQKCAELGMPVNMHVGYGSWFAEEMDETNDGLMLAWIYRVEITPGIVSPEGMIDIFERTLKKHPNTTFIGAHLITKVDFTKVGRLLDRYPNLYIDNSASCAEIATIPRTSASFFEKYQDRIVYGTDWIPVPEMNRISFRILETLDEHFYATGYLGLPLSLGYHWPMYGLGLSDVTLLKVYRENALKILESRSKNGN